MASGDGVTDIVDQSGNGKGVALDVYPTFVSGSVIVVASIADLQVQSHAQGALVYLSLGNRSGFFRYTTNNVSSFVGVDPRQGIFVAPADDLTGVSGAWVRIDWTVIDCHWFGVVGDNIVDDAPPINAAFVVAEAFGFSVDYGLATPPVHLRMGKYYAATSLIPQQTTQFYGDGGKGDAGGSATEIRFAANCTGIDLKYDLGIRAPSISLQGLCLRGNYTGFTSEGEYHGVRSAVRFRARDVMAIGFQGDGFHIEASAGAPNNFLENANCFVIEDCWADSCRNGLYIQGADANAGRVVGFNANSNRRWGVLDISFLGNTHIAHHAQDNGIYDPNTPKSPPSVVSYAGNRYCVVYGQEAGASVNAPSGTTADNAYWIYMQVGGVSTANGSNIPAWSNGMTLRSGGSYYLDGLNGGAALINCYAELGQGFNQFGSAAAVSFHGFLPRRSSSSMWGQFDGLNVYKMVVKGNFDVTGVASFGPSSGTPSGGQVYLNNTSNNVAVNARSWNPDGSFNKDLGSLFWVDGFGSFYDCANAGWAHNFRVAGSNVAFINNSGFDTASGKVYKVNGTQVVGPRGAAITAPTGGATVDTQARTAISDLISRLQAHGLIS